AAHEDDEAYRQGQGVDPIAGIEAMISHYLVSRLQIPAAHAPVFTEEAAAPAMASLVDPRAASGFMGSAFLPCVVTGLAKAPQFQPGFAGQAGIAVDQLSALVVPADALGSVPVLCAMKRGIPVLAVENNKSVMQCPAESLGLANRVIVCGSYLEAL